MMNRSKLANAIRVLSMDAVEKAASGHPGAPMGMADIAEVLWRDFLKHNPTNPEWPNRDRFILSNGHGSMLIYSLLHLSGYELSIDDIKSFRQLHSKTAGHPEYGYAPGIETTTGPLGQGITNGVGMALAEKVLAEQFNRETYNIVDHHTYVFMGDGCMMEGISHEACSLAGTLGLGKLIAFWDDNGISIDGEVDGWFSDDTPKRFEAYGWQVLANVDGHDANAISEAIATAKLDENRPTLICCKTVIGYGSPNKSGSHDCHGAPLGADEVKLVRQQLEWPHAEFEIPAEVYSEWDAKEQGAQSESEWQELFTAYQQAFPELAKEFTRRTNKSLPEEWSSISEKVIADLQQNPQNIASRKASQNALEAFAPMLPEFFGGSADLTPSNLTNWTGSKAITTADASGNYLSYGVREFAMSAMMNGMALHGGFIPYGGTFLMFMEYAKNALRMASLMKQRAIFVYTHDSIGLGEDGPTHQPIEQISSLRLTPNMSTWRPCDQVETAVAWKYAVGRVDGPTSLIFSRQNLPQFDRDQQTLSNVARGGYVLSDCGGEPELIIIATGSEVNLAMQAKQVLAEKGIEVRVVSMPCTDAFDKQSAEYKESVLPSGVHCRLAIEAGIKDYWYKYVGLDGDIVAMTTFGESAPADQLFELYGFTVDNVVSKAQAVLDKNNG
ncbi:transketolase 2 [Vibrio sp. MACH09]|uniref:transketolase n=1 Tax=Vibrio sp. MACH09 TaxID=3025122 RepID=UPI0027944EB9|nr:transketolase [Vibrio sp. MACH09]GLO62885.1 transketolase 2 [Vibrio sp. MACH09]